jgi:hypothetical protein
MLLLQLILFYTSFFSSFLIENHRSSLEFIHHCYNQQEKKYAIDEKCHLIRFGFNPKKKDCSIVRLMDGTSSILIVNVDKRDVIYYATTFFLQVARKMLHFFLSFFFSIDINIIAAQINYIIFFFFLFLLKMLSFFAEKTQLCMLADKGFPI